MIAADVLYASVPAEVSQVSAYQWRAGSRPESLHVGVRWRDREAIVTVSAADTIVVQFTRPDGRYLLDGPFTPSASRSDRVLDRTWRHTVSGRFDRPVYAPSPIVWVATTGAGGDAWPACWWTTSETWECAGVASGAAGVVVVPAGSAIWSGAVVGDVAPVLRKSTWGRLLAVRDRDDDRIPRLRVVAARPAPPKAQRLDGVRVETAAVPGVRVTPIAAGAVWLTGDLSPPDAWLDVRSTRSGPKFLPLADVSDGSPLVPLDVLLDDTRTVRVRVVSDRGDPVGAALVTTFRMIDPVEVRRAPGEKPPRRVLAAEGTANADGTVDVRVGEAQYEVVAWHPQLGKAAVLLDQAATEVTVRLRSPGVARGRVLVAGKPVAGVTVETMADPAAYAAAVDPLDVKGGWAQTTGDGRFVVVLAAGGGGELRVGGGAYAVKRVPLPRAPLPLVELGDIELGRPVTLSLVLDQDPGCDLRAAGPVGRTGLQIVVATRTGPGLFSLTVPEEGAWEIGLVCGRDERAVTPAVVQVTATGRPQDVRLTMR